MNENHLHLLTIFSTALEYSSGEDRKAYLDKACMSLPELRQKVEALLRANDQPGAFLSESQPSIQEPACCGPSAQSLVPRTASMIAQSVDLGAMIGPYRLLQEIGEGGMGKVFMAEQTHPVKRRVALKLIRPGIESHSILGRFEAERQSLALMDHPNIAKVLDAGSTDDGRPYFVMELVKGMPITQFCDQRKLTIRERIALFIPVCQAVQHAHHKGIIHRDLKPNNVMVALYDDLPVPKVIDFGIAKATGVKLTDKSFFTDFGAVIGTLEYMSPEQATLNQLDIDTRSDVYSLGVLLFELLTGSTPIDRKALGKAGLLEILKIIQESEAPRPSVRLSTTKQLPIVASNRGLDPQQLGGAVRGDLDWVVTKALERDRKRRYETASALAHDLDRYLKDENVEACPPSVGYRLRKSFRRHRVAVSVASFVAVVLILASTISTWQAIRASRAEKLALQSAEIERLTNRFFIHDLLGKASVGAQAIAEIPPDSEIKVRTLVDRAANRIDDSFDGVPLVEAAVRHMIGSVYNSLGLPAEARPQLERAETIRRELLGEADPDTLSTSGELGEIDQRLSRYDQAETRLRRTLDLAVKHHGQSSELSIVTLSRLGLCLLNAGQVELASEMLKQSWELSQQSDSIAPSQRTVHQNNYALSLLHLNLELEAGEVFERTLQEATQQIGENHPVVPVIRINLALIHRNQGRFNEGIMMAKEAHRGCLVMYGPRHLLSLVALENIGHCLMSLGKLDEAQQVFEEKYALESELFGSQSELALRSQINLGQVLSQRGSYGEAEKLLLDIRESAGRAGPTLGAFLDGILGSHYLRMGRPAEAETRLREAEKQWSTFGVAERRLRDQLQLELAEACSALGRRREAVDRYRELLTVFEQRYGSEHPLLLAAISRLASHYREMGEWDKAEILFPQALALTIRLKGPEHVDVMGIEQNFAALHHVRGRFEEAERLYRNSLAAMERTGLVDRGSALIVQSNLGELYRDWGRPDQAEPIFLHVLEIQRNALGEGHPLTLWTLWKLAELERDAGRLDEAEANLLICLEGYTKVQEPEGLDIATLRVDLAMNHLKQGRSLEAEQLLKAALTVYDRELPNDWRRFEIQGQLGEAIAAQGRHAEAEPLILTGHQGLLERYDNITVDAWARRPDSLGRITAFYESWDKPEDAKLWRQRELARQKKQPGTLTSAVKPKED